MARKSDLTELTPEESVEPFNALGSDEERADKCDDDFDDAVENEEIEKAGEVYEPGEARPLTRDDFPSTEEWLRYRREGCFDDRDYESNSGNGPESQLYRAIYGHTLRRFQVAWEFRGTSYAITEKKFADTYAAVAFANRLSVVLNMHVTIAWSTIGVVDDIDVNIANRRLLDAIGRYFDKTLKIGRYWIWALERGKKRGLHTHLVVYVPLIAYNDFCEMLERSVKTITGKQPLVTDTSSTICVRKAREALDFNSQWNWFRYLMKGLRSDDIMSDWRKRSKLDRLASSARITPEDEGEVRTKRVGVSRCIDRAARLKDSKDSGFKDLWSQGIRDPDQLYGSVYYMSRQLYDLARTISV